jgi:hypothetical protein
MASQRFTRFVGGSARSGAPFCRRLPSETLFLKWANVLRVLGFGRIVFHPNCRFAMRWDRAPSPRFQRFPIAGRKLEGAWRIVVAQTAQPAMKPALAPGHCSILPHLAAGLVAVLVKRLAHDPASAVIEGSRVGLVARSAADSRWRWGLGDILNDALAREIDGVEDVAG